MVAVWDGDYVNVYVGMPSEVFTRGNFAAEGQRYMVS